MKNRGWGNHDNVIKDLRPPGWISCGQIDPFNKPLVNHSSALVNHKGKSEMGHPHFVQNSGILEPVGKLQFISEKPSNVISFWVTDF